MVEIPISADVPTASSTCTLYHGDCLEVMPTLQPKSVNMTFADLPYASTDNHWDCAFDVKSFWKASSAAISSRAVYAMTATQPFTTSLINSNSKRFRYDLIVRKTTPVGFLNAKKMPMRNHEHILIFYNKLPVYNPQKWTGPVAYKARSRAGSNTSYGFKPETFRKENDGQRYPLSVLDIKSIKRQESLHPTQKPIALLEWLIKTYTNPGDTVLDPVFGSATTAVACARLGRNFIGIEKDAEYFKIGTERVNKERLTLGLEPAEVVS